MDPDAFSNRSYGNMENSFILSSIRLFQGYFDTEQETKYFCPEPVVAYSTRRKIKSVIRENFENSYVKAFGMWEAISHRYCVF